MSDPIKIDHTMLKRIRDSLYGVSHIADARGEEAHAIVSYFPALLSQPAEQQEQVNEEVKVVAWRIGSPNWPGAKVYEQRQDWAYEQWGPITYTVDELMTVHQHQRIVDGLQSELNDLARQLSKTICQLSTATAQPQNTE